MCNIVVKNTCVNVSISLLLKDGPKSETRAVAFGIGGRLTAVLKLVWMCINFVLLAIYQILILWLIFAFCRMEESATAVLLSLQHNIPV